MRIGMVSATYDPSVINGAVRMVTLYKQHLEARGHEVTIFTLGDEQEGDGAARIVRSSGFRLGDHGYFVGLRYSREAQMLLTEMEVVHCHHLLMSVEMAHRYARCPIVYTNHTRYDLYTGAYTPLPQPAADAIMRQLWPEFAGLADTVIAPSGSVRQLLLDFGVRDPIVVIENGIELEPFLRPRRPRAKSDFGLPDSAFLLVYIGRLSSEKNLLGLLEQVGRACQVVPELQLAIFGKGPQEEELRQRATELGLDECVRFMGVVPFDEVSDWLAAGDAFVTASTSEVHPLTVIEAMAAGLPIAAVQSPGIVDCVESGITGFTPTEAEGLDSAIVALAANPARARAMGQAAREASRRFDIGRTVSLTVELYESLLAARPDLRRDDPHGRWSRRTEKWAGLLDQLAQLVRPSDDNDEGWRRWWPGTALSGRKEQDE